MTGRARSAMLAEADVDVLARWADAVLAETEVHVSKAPAAELAHMQFRDPLRDEPFFLGEVLFHECVVEIGTATGYGYALGQEPERALYAAVLDAALNAGHRLSAEITAALEDAAAQALRRRGLESTLAERTRVRFEVMDG